MKHLATVAVAVTFLLATSAFAEEEETKTTTTTTTVKKEKKKDKKDKEKEKEGEGEGHEGHGEGEPHRSGAGAQTYSLISAQTVGTDRNFINVQAGWPGLMATFVHGQNDTFDIGGRFGLMWAPEDSSTGLIGLRGQFVMRWLLAQIDNVKLGLEFEPGIEGFFVGLPYFGIILPVKFVAAFPITNALTLTAGADLPLAFNFGGIAGGGFFFATIPLMFGGGIEYVINETISLNAKFRLGPSFHAGTIPFFGAGAFFGAPSVWLGADGLVGISIRI